MTKSQKKHLLQKKAINNIEDINVNNILIPEKRNHMIIKTHLNILLDAMIMISLDHYA